MGNTASVTVGNNVFSPTNRSVTQGATITWTWSPGGVAHNVTFDDGPASATQSSGTHQRTFFTIGSYPYHCTIHGAAMSGTVAVTAGP
jgi:plastocyanin